MVHLIINADDFGMSNTFNNCILQLLIDKKICSTTVMVNRISDSQKEKVQDLRNLIDASEVSVGLHVEFTYDQHLEQVHDQYRKFNDLFGRAPSHLDIHKEHLYTKYHPVVAYFCRNNRLPFRNHGKKFSGVPTTSKKYFYGSLEDFGRIDEWLKSLEDEKYYELVFHPGLYDPYCFSSLNKERKRDIFHIERIHENLKMYNVRLESFNQLKEVK